MASRFWVGGTGTWDSTTTTHWATGSGLGGGASAPIAGDTVTFDGSSGGGTVTADTSILGIAFGALTAGAFTGTIDTTAVSGMSFLTMSLTGTGARKFLFNGTTFTLTSTLGSNTFDFATTTNVDPTSNTAANFTFTATTANQRIFAGGGRTYGTLTISTNSSRGWFAVTGANTFAGISLAAGTSIGLPQGATTTITNAFTLTGTSSLPISLGAFGANAATISIGTGTASLDFGVLQGTTVTGGATFNATNTFDSGKNTGWATLTAPSGGTAGAGAFFGS